MQDASKGELAAEDLVLWCRRTLPDDTRAFEYLVAHYKRRVFGIAYRMLGDYEEAEDQTQEIFLKVYRGILKLDTPTNLSAWITRIAVNTCLDCLERTRRRPPVARFEPLTEDQPEREYADTASPSPEETALQRELRRCLEETLSQIDPKERAVLILRDVEERPYAEVAQALKIGLSAAKMRVHRARLAFQRIIERLCPESWRQSLNMLAR